MNKSIIECSQLHKFYQDGKETVNVLNGIDLTINASDRIAIVGPSGSGKSTLLHLLGGLDYPSRGHVLINGVNWYAMSEKNRCVTRNNMLGFIYQFHHLLAEFTAMENVAMPLLIAGMTFAKAQKQAQAILGEVGLSHRLTHKPSQLSGGERQRVAIARALIHEPRCVFADEPTGNLDQATAAKVFDLMLTLNAQIKTALVIVTHDLQLARRMDKSIVLSEGKLGSEGSLG